MRIRHRGRGGRAGCRERERPEAYVFFSVEGNCSAFVPQSFTRVATRLFRKQFGVKSVVPVCPCTARLYCLHLCRFCACASKLAAVYTLLLFVFHLEAPCIIIIVISVKSHLLCVYVQVTILLSAPREILSVSVVHAHKDCAPPTSSEFFSMSVNANIHTSAVHHCPASSHCEACTEHYKYLGGCRDPLRQNAGQ